MKRAIAVVGPTAIGKSSLGIQIALAFDGEIVSADSRQIYRLMDIGTAKPSTEDQQKVSHHLIDIIWPDETYSVAQFHEQAYAKLDDIDSRAKQPILVGGSGQYIWSVVENWKIPRVVPDIGYRDALLERAEREGYLALYAELCDIDKEAARKIEPANVRRVIRALEIHHQTHDLPSSIIKQSPAEYEFLILGLTASRSYLYNMIDNRIELMVKHGFIEEVRNLLEKGYPAGLPAMSGIGYRQVCQYLEGKMGQQESVQKIKYATHRFARSQYNWFRLDDERIHWFDVQNDNHSEINYTIKTFLETC